MGHPSGRREFLSRATTGVIAAGMVDASLAVAQTGQAVEGQPTHPLTNDSVPLTIKTEFDLPALRIGVAEYPEGPTGCTIFHFPKGARCAIDVRGGSPGTLMAGDGLLDALCYTGGSAYGLEAATGVSAELLAMRSYSTQWGEIAIVRAAVIFDYRVRKNAIYPDNTLGRAALKSARTGIFPLGRRGAGCSATVGKVFDAANLDETAGQGGAFRQVGPTKIAVFTVVNAVGGIHDRQGQIVRGLLDRKSGKRLRVTELLERQLSDQASSRSSPGNTTLTAVITNQKLEAGQLTQLARQVHSSMARAIQPFHTWNDGDVLYAVTTGEVEATSLDPTALGILASELAWDAVLNCYQEG
jgi:6-aminohexanoate-oligomer endohydrolase